MYDFLRETVDPLVRTVGTPQSIAITEVDRYLKQNPAHLSIDPLLWWRENKIDFPYISEIVQETFCIMATSVPCERVFSKAGLILSDRRASLSANKVKQLLFLNSNLNE